MSLSFVNDSTDIWRKLTTVGLLLFTGTNFSGIFNRIVDLAGIKFSDFAITCSIYSKMCYEFNISGYNF